jgi:predicted NAD/FAD-binding protein
MAEFVHFVVEDVYEKGNLDETRRVFQLLEKLLVESDQETRTFICLGFSETLQNFASWRPEGNKVYEQFFGPMSTKVWSELQTMWTGKSSLMDVIRAEQENK